MKREKSCGALCFAREDGVEKVLMVKHRAGGHWAFPKGHVERGETEEQTACREVREETGVKIEIDPGYFDIACKRVEEAYRQPDMFVTRAPAPQQEAMDL